MDTTREHQIVTLTGTHRFKGTQSRTFTGITVSRIGIRPRDGATYGTCKINGLAYGLVLVPGSTNRWTEQHTR